MLVLFTLIVAGLWAMVFMVNPTGTESGYFIPAIIASIIWFVWMIVEFAGGGGGRSSGSSDGSWFDGIGGGDGGGGGGGGD